MKKRIIAFILTIFILLPLLPKPIQAKGFVKEIDVIQDDFDLKVEGKAISSKEFFIYDGELWIPLSDLGKGLELKTHFNPTLRKFWINSKGKLNIDDASQANVAFQRGYEIQAKERIIAELDKEIQAFDGKVMSKTSSEDSVVKNISVGFGHLDVFIDNQKLNLSRDPLIYNNDLYVSLVDISPHLYITPSLVGNTLNIDGNAILLKKDGYDSFDDLAKFRDSLNNRLGTQLAEMEKRKKIIMDVKIPYEDIKTLSAMERYLNRHLGKIDELPINISLRSGNDNWYYVDIDFLKKDNPLWRDLTRRDVEAHIWDIFVALTSLYDEDAKIQGTIRNPNYARTSSSDKKDYVKFTTNLKDLEFNFINSGLDLKGQTDPILIEDILKKHLGRYLGENFDYSAKLGASSLDLIVKPGSSTYMEKWSPDKKLRLLREINYEIKRYFPNLKVNGRVEYPGQDTIPFLIENGKIASSAILDEFVEDLNKTYEFFRTGDLRIPMDYKIIQRDISNYELLVDMDFDKNASPWTEASKNDLARQLQDIVTEIISLWDVNVFVKAFDKNQNILSDFMISQDTVQGVTASPGPGNIVEGSKVFLQTSTPNATIYYTLDGSSPSENKDNRYTGPIELKKSTTIKAYAVKEGFKDSPLYDFKYAVVLDENMASGLGSLGVQGGSLEPNFHTSVHDYKFNVDDSKDPISLSPKADKGSIQINGKDIASGDSMKIDLDTKNIEIKHMEKDKTDRIYTIEIIRKDDDSDDEDEDIVEEIDLDPNYTFSTSIVGIFRGNLTGSRSDYDIYKVELRSGTETLYKTIDVDSSGSFNTNTFPIDIFDRPLGYYYRIIDTSNNDKIINSGKLKVQ